MKEILTPVIIALATFIITVSCGGKRTGEGNATPETDTITVPDTGFTGIKQYTSQSYLIKEVTFKNGVRQGLMKTFYENGKLRQTFWYENGLREDSSRWYYMEGQLFRTTPYKRDTADGIQKQYFRTGKLKAKIGYSKGLRTPYIEEFTPEGRLITSYPDLVVGTRDEYASKGLYRIDLSLSDRNGKARYYIGDLAGGVFDTTRVKRINPVKGVATITLKKSGAEGIKSLGVIAEILTNYGNNRLVYKNIELPYNDLK
jgi:hypothetical protein